MFSVPYASIFGSKVAFIIIQVSTMNPGTPMQKVTEGFK